MPVIRVTQDDFAISSEYEALRACAPQAGAIVVFTGLVRDISGETAVNGLTLQHYPGMTEKLLAEIVEQAHDRWEIEDVRVIHRVGTLHPAEQIVFVGVAAAHRETHLKRVHTLWITLRYGQLYGKRNPDQREKYGSTTAKAIR